MHHVVLDEADLLLSGGFERDVYRLLEGLKHNDKERKAQCLSQELGIPLEAFQALPRHVKAAAYEGMRTSAVGLAGHLAGLEHGMAEMLLSDMQA